MGFARSGGLIGLAAIGLLAAQCSAPVHRNKPKMRKYEAPIGPPYPASRQHLRAMMRAAAKAKIA